MERARCRSRLFTASRLNRSEREELFDIFAATCRWTRVYYGWRPNLRDEGDNHVIELAVAGDREQKYEGFHAGARVAIPAIAHPDAGTTIERGGMSALIIRLPQEKRDRLQQVAKERKLGVNKLIEEMATVAIAEQDAEVRFQVRAARGRGKAAGRRSPQPV